MLASFYFKDPPRSVVLLKGLPSRDFYLPASCYKLLEKRLKVRPTHPSVTVCYREIFNILPHAMLQAVVKGGDELLLKIWTPFYTADLQT